MMNEKRIRAAVVGCGSIAPVHIKGLLAADVEIVALCDIIPERAAALAEKFSITPMIYTELSAMLEEAKPDSLHVCTPHYLHADMVCEALGRGINVLCEKPLAITEEGLKRVLEAEADSAATLGVCLQNRYEESMICLRQRVADTGIKTGAGIMLWKRDAEYYASGDWRGTIAEEGGGVLINQALHTLDLLQWIFGMPQQLTAHLSNDHLAGIIEVEDTASILCRCESGVAYNFFASTAASANLPAQLQCILGDGSRVFATNELLVIGDEPIQHNLSPTRPIGKSVWGTGHRRLITDYYGHIRAGKPFPISGKEGAAVIRLILAAYRSCGEWVDI